MKQFELVKNLKIFDKADKQVLEMYNFDENWYIASAKSMWNIEQFNPNDFEIYTGDKEVGEYDFEYKVVD